MGNSAFNKSSIATPVGPTIGGTGQTSITTGDILYGSASNTISKLAIGTTDQVLKVTGGVPAWGSAGGNLLSGSVSGAATLDIDLSAYYNVYKTFIITLYNCYPSTDNVALWMRVSTDGSTYDAGASNYAWTLQYALDNSVSGGNGNTGDTEIELTGGEGNTQANAGQHIIEIQGLDHASYRLKVLALGNWQKSSGNGSNTISHRIGGTRLAAQVTKAVRFLYSSGNINAYYTVRGY